MIDLSGFRPTTISISAFQSFSFFVLSARLLAILCFQVFSVSAFQSF